MILEETEGYRLYLEKYQDLPHIITLVKFKNRGTKEYQEQIISRLGLNDRHQITKICPVLAGKIHQAISNVTPVRLTSRGGSWMLTKTKARHIQKLIQTSHAQSI